MYVCVYQCGHISAPFLPFVCTIGGVCLWFIYAGNSIEADSLSGENECTVCMHTLEPYDLIGLKLCIKDVCCCSVLAPVMRPLERWG